MNTTQKDIFERVQKVVAKELKMDPEKVVMEAHFVDDLGADSLSNIELVMELESEFDIEIHDDDTPNITTVKAAVAYIEKALEEYA